MITLKEFINEGLINIHKNNKRQNKTFGELNPGDTIWYTNRKFNFEIQKCTVERITYGDQGLLSFTDKNPNNGKYVIVDTTIKLEKYGLVGVKSDCVWMYKNHNNSFNKDFDIFVSCVDPKIYYNELKRLNSDLKF